MRAALETARQCRVLRHAGNLESVLICEGTEEVHQLAVGKAVTGYSAFRLATTLEAPHICGNPAVVGRLQRPLRLSVVVMTGRAFERANADVRRSGWQQVRAGAGT